MYWPTMPTHSASEITPDMNIKEVWRPEGTKYLLSVDKASPKIGDLPTPKTSMEIQKSVSLVLAKPINMIALVEHMITTAI